MKKFLWLIFIGLLLSPVVYGQSSEFLQYDKNLIVRKLDNGLTYYIYPVSYTHLRAHETDSYLVCRLLLEKKKTTIV